MNNTLKVTAPSDREIAMTRVFEAPRSLVFHALTKPDLIKRWLLGPPGWSMPVCEIDFRVGGAYRYVWRRDDDGAEMGMGGVYREIVPPQRIINTEKFEEGEALVTTVLVQEGGKTTLTATMLFDSREARDEVLKSGMEKGAAESYNRLAELLESDSQEEEEI
jgi:uncharacterized protein YndB with AHSA1/START domain